MHACMYVSNMCMYVCMYVSTYVCVCMYVRMCVYMCVWGQPLYQMAITPASKF